MSEEFRFLEYMRGLVQNLDGLDGAQRRVRIELLKQTVNKSKAILMEQFSESEQIANLKGRIHRLMGALPNVHKMRAYARMFEDGEPMKRDLTTWANNAERAMDEWECVCSGGLDRYAFINERIAELLSLGESWDETSARKEAEMEWELQQEEHRDALGAD